VLRPVRLGDFLAAVLARGVAPGRLVPELPELLSAGGTQTGGRRPVLVGVLSSGPRGLSSLLLGLAEVEVSLLGTVRRAMRGEPQSLHRAGNRSDSPSYGLPDLLLGLALVVKFDDPLLDLGSER